MPRKEKNWVHKAVGKNNKFLNLSSPKFCDFFISLIAMPNFIFVLKINSFHWPGLSHFILF